MTSRLILASLILSTALSQVAFAHGAEKAHANTSSQKLTRELQKLQTNGFTDMKVVPGFLVRAKDKSGDPVIVMIGPHMSTMITRISDTTTGTGSSGKE